MQAYNPFQKASLYWSRVGKSDPTMRVDIGTSYMEATLCGPGVVKNYIQGYDMPVISIGPFRVDEGTRRMGIGTRFVRIAAKEAASCGAGAMEAGIVERSGVRIMVDVFGYDRIRTFPMHLDDGVKEVSLPELNRSFQPVTVVADITGLGSAPWETPVYTSSFRPEAERLQAP